MAEGRVLFQRDVLGEKELLERYPKLIAKIHAGEFKAANLHKLEAFDLWSAYEDIKDRLILSTEEIDGLTYLAAVRGMDDHKYKRLDAAVLHRYAERNRDLFETQARAITTGELKWVPANEEEAEKRFEKIRAKKDQVIIFEPVDYLGDRVIIYAEEQKEIIGAQIWGKKGVRKLIDLQGPAGSGKSLVAMVMAQNYDEGDVDVITPTEGLARDWEDQLNQLRVGKPPLAHRIRCISKRELYIEQHPELKFADLDSDSDSETEEVVEDKTDKWQFVDEEEFYKCFPDFCSSIKSWTKQQKIDKEFHHLKKYPEYIYQEFYSLGIHKAEESYQRLSDDRAIFKKGPWRTLVWKFHELYEAHLPTKKFIDSNLIKLELEKQDKLLILEEAHDFSMPDLCHLPNVYKDCVLISDPHQRTVSCLAMVPDLKEFLGRPDLVSFNLTDPKRYSAPTTRVANAALHFKSVVTGEKAYKGAYTQIPITKGQEKRPGEGYLKRTIDIAELKKEVDEFKEKFSIDDEIALVVPLKKNPALKKKNEEKLAAIAQAFGGDLIFTDVKQVKGLGYKVILGFDPFQEEMHQANKEYRLITKSEGSAISRIEGINPKIIYNKAINEFFTILTRNSHTFVIFSEVNRNVDEIAKLITTALEPAATAAPENKALTGTDSETGTAPSPSHSPTSSSAVSAATLSDEKPEEKVEVKSDDTRKLAEAIRQIRHGNYKLAKNICTSLGKTESEYNELEKEHKIKFRHTKIKPNAEPVIGMPLEQKKSSPDAPDISPKPIAKVAPIAPILTSTASIVSATKQEDQSSKKRKLTATDSPGMDVKKLDPSTFYSRKLLILESLEDHGAGHIFTRDTFGSCAFAEACTYPIYCKNLGEIANENPGLFEKLPVTQLFEIFKDPSRNHSPFALIYIILRHPELHGLLKNWLSKLNDSGLKFLILKLFKKDLLSYVATVYPELILFLIDTYAQFSLMLAPAIAGDIQSGSENLLINNFAESEKGCEVLSRLAVVEKNFLPSIPPSLMFKVRKHEKDKTHLAYPVTLLQDISKNAGKDNHFLKRWLTLDAWLDPKVLPLINSRIIRQIMLIGGTEQHYLLRLIHKNPDFLNNLRILFERPEGCPSLFFLFCQFTCFHPYLNQKPNWNKFTGLDAHEFFGQTQDSSSSISFSRANVPLNLTQSDEGFKLLLSIYKAREDLCKQASSDAALFGLIKYSHAGSQQLLTCFYRILNSNPIGREIIELLKQKNKKLTQEYIVEMLEKSGFNFLTNNEIETINELKQNLSVAGIGELARQPNAKRLFFSTTGFAGDRNLVYDLLVDPTKAIVFADAIEQFNLLPLLIDHLVKNEVWFGDGKEYQYLHPLCKTREGRQILKMLDRYPNYFLALNIEEFFKFEINGMLAYEAILRDESLHWLLYEMCYNSQAQQFVSRCSALKLSQGDALSMTCNFLPKLALSLAKNVEPIVSAASLFFGKQDTISSRFYWLARYPAAHEILYGIFDQYKNLFAKIAPNNLCLELPAPFAPFAKVSPLHTLALTPYGRSFLRVYVQNCEAEKLKILANNTKQLCKVTHLTNENYKNKDIIGILLCSMDAHGDDCSRIAVALVNANPDLIDQTCGADFATRQIVLMTLRDTPGVSKKVFEQINKRLTQMSEAFTLVDFVEKAAENEAITSSAPTLK